MPVLRQRFPEWVALAAGALGTLLACIAAVGALVADNILVPVTVPESSVGDVVGPVTAALRIAEPTAGERLWTFAPSLVLAVQVAVVGLLLFRVVRSLRTGDPFAPANARRVWACAVVVLVGGLLAAALRTFGHRSAVAAAGAPDLEAVVDLPVVAAVLGLGLAAAAEFLRRGAALREDVRGLV
ncbi:MULTISPECIES: DUF2975 domain-containing protein [unclassified Nocardiopsis]|uniref:DUF2975 domain-containing protein n=1 Tax=unclassified Nocardiopsis TaxID=2649073 RepID=UPI001358A1DD|nr:MULTISPECIES: DUF2975 domain-containing protein [unclassified Nocardiopsis]